MNQDQVKELLIRIEKPESDFTLVFTGKKSSMVNGLYKPLTHEILLHNKNFSSDSQLIYTAIHEYAHHLHTEKRPYIQGCRSHSNEFWVIFHSLLGKAEALGIYQNIFASDDDFLSVTQRIRALFPENGKIMLELGKLMTEAEALCKKHCVRFEDYIDRAVCMPRSSAHAAIRAQTYSVPPELGWDAMKFVSGIRNAEARTGAIEAFGAGKSPDFVKALAKKEKPADDPKTRLLEERARVERAIHNLEERLTAINGELEKIV